MEIPADEPLGVLDSGHPNYGDEYDVVLLDLSAELIAVAREQFSLEPEAVQKRLLRSIVGGIRGISSLADDCFDVTVGRGWFRSAARLALVWASGQGFGSSHPLRSRRSFSHGQVP